jgi:hypothetical protein
METLGIPLTFELLYYDPSLLFAFETICQRIANRLRTGLSYLHTLVESQQYDKTAPRNLTYERSKELLKYILQTPTKLVYVIGQEICIFDVL